MSVRAGGDVTDSSTTLMTLTSFPKRSVEVARELRQKLVLGSFRDQDFDCVALVLQGAEERHRLRQKIVHPLVELVFIRMRLTLDRDVCRRARSSVLRSVHVMDIDFARIGCSCD